MRRAVWPAIALAAAVACVGERGERRAAGGYAGREVAEPRPRPEFVLTTADGRPYDFRKETAGRLTFLFFGYTNCPDVCPVHMANLAAALRQVPARDAREVTVVFVTTDPERDTPARLREWLGGFDPTFVALTGEPGELADAQVAAGVMPAARDTASGADYAVGHAAQVLAYTADDSLRVVYPFGTRQADWVHDIPRLLRRSS